jgi:hypothetical protein
METQFNNAFNYVKNMPMKGCLTGSSMLGYIEGGNQDIDLFAYSEKGFTQMFYHLYYDDRFQILDPLELWKAERFMEKKEKDNFKFVLTIKFIYNLSIPINIIFKNKSKDIFSVISSFDMDIICKGYDLQTKQYLDLSENLPNKKTTWNKWNTAFYSNEIWDISKILRQLERCFKYHKRGYNTDDIVLKYIELIGELQKSQDIFHSINYTDRLKTTKKNTKVVKQICEIWLETHEITDKQIELLKEKIKEI